MAYINSNTHSEPILPLHSHRKTQNFAVGIGPKIYLRVTEKYVLAIVIIAFTLVFLGASYLPSISNQDDVVVRAIRNVESGFKPVVKDPHGHGDGEVRADHRGHEVEKFNDKAKSDIEIQQEINSMKAHLELNHQKMKTLESRLQSVLKTHADNHPKANDIPDVKQEKPISDDENKNAEPGKALDEMCNVYCTGNSHSDSNKCQLAGLFSL